MLRVTLDLSAGVAVRIHKLLLEQYPKEEQAIAQLTEVLKTELVPQLDEAIAHLERALEN